jgi:mannosyltransferase
MSAPSRARAPERLAPALIALTVLAAAVRFSTLSVQSYWLDEAVTVHLLRDSFGGMLAAIPDSESTPPLYYIVAWVWSKLFGTGEVALRSLSALFGTATVPVAYMAAKTLATRRVGLVVAALAAVNPLLVWFSQEARAYALLVLLTTAGLAAFARVLERTGPPARALAAWAVLSALALAAHYFALFVVGPQAVWLLWRLRRRAVAPVAGVALAGAALLPLAVHQAGNNRANFIREVTLGSRILQVPKQFLAGYDAPLEVAVAITSVALAGYGLYLLATRARGRERSGAAAAGRIAAPALVVPLILAVAGADYLITRNLIAAWVPAMIVVAAGLGAARAGRAGVAATAALCVLSLGTVIAVDASPRHQRGDWRDAARALGPIPHYGRALVIDPVYGAIPLGLYTPRLTVLPPGPVGVGEIDVLSVGGRGFSESHGPSREVAPPPPGFRPGEVAKTDTYTLVRYRPVNAYYAVSVPVLWALSPTGNTSDIAFQAPPGWQRPPG